MTPEITAIALRRTPLCPQCKELSAIITRFAKVVKDKQRHIDDQDAFIAKLKRIFREESSSPMRVTPLDRPARNGKL